MYVISWGVHCSTHIGLFSFEKTSSYLYHKPYITIFFRVCLNPKLTTVQHEVLNPLFVSFLTSYSDNEMEPSDNHMQMFASSWWSMIAAGWEKWTPSSSFECVQSNKKTRMFPSILLNSKSSSKDFSSILHLLHQF